METKQQINITVFCYVVVVDPMTDGGEVISSLLWYPSTV
jgi:hypothetical protein